MNISRGYTSGTEISVGCLICGEYVELTLNEKLSVRNCYRIHKICDKCKATILYVRKQLEEAEVE